jgi:hypothetical protein
MSAESISHFFSTYKPIPMMLTVPDKCGAMRIQAASGGASFVPDIWIRVRDPVGDKTLTSSDQGGLIAAQT